MTPTKAGINQHDILHQHYPGDCCLCKSETEILSLKAHIALLEGRKTTNEPAFPHDVFMEGSFDAGDWKLAKHQSGLTIRDYFAAKAMSHFKIDKETDYTLLAKYSYQIADAMLLERVQK